MDSRERVVEELRAAGLAPHQVADVLDAVDDYAYERYQDGVCDGEQAPDL